MTIQQIEAKVTELGDALEAKLDAKLEEKLSPLKQEINHRLTCLEERINELTELVRSDNYYLCFDDDCDNNCCYSDDDCD